MAALEGKVVIVTGASSGIGRVTAHQLAAAGAQLVLAARRADRLETLAEELGREFGSEVLLQPTDVSSRADVAAMAAAAFGKFGHVDVLVNNAGIMPLSFLAKRKLDEWDRMIDVNVKGLLYCIDAVFSHMLERGSGHIVNVSSMAGHRVMPSGAVYSATKFAVRAITEGLRMEGQGKVRATVVCPGAFRTELASTITDRDVAGVLGHVASQASDPIHVARSILFALEQPAEASIQEIIVAPSAQTA